MTDERSTSSVANKSRSTLAGGVGAVLTIIALSSAGTALINIADNIFTAVATVELRLSTGALTTFAYTTGVAGHSFRNACVISQITTSCRARIAGAAGLTRATARAAGVIVTGKIRTAIALLAAWFARAAAQGARSIVAGHSVVQGHRRYHLDNYRRCTNRPPRDMSIQHHHCCLGP